MNSQSDPTSVKFSHGGGLVPMGRRIVSLLGRWYYGLSMAFKNIFLSKRHVYLSLLQSCSFWMEHTGACFVFGREGSTWKRAHHCSAGSTDRGSRGGTGGTTECRGFLASAIWQKLHSAKKRGVEENVTLGSILHPPKSAIVLGGNRINVQRDLPPSLNVTSRVGALLFSQPFWGIIVGNERAGKTLPEHVGGEKATPHAGNTLDVWITLKRLFREVRVRLSDLCRCKENSFAQQNSSPCPEMCLATAKWERDGHPLTVMDEPLNTCLLQEVII